MLNEETSSTMPVDESQTAELLKTVNKRRSLLFQRRSINHVPDDTQSSDNDEAEDIGKECKLQSSSEEDFDLREYIIQLRDEREEWRKKLSERKSERRQLAKRDSSMGNECELDLSVLSESDRAFLAARPNYHEISKNIDNLIPLAAKIATLGSHINHLNKNLTQGLKEKVGEATKQVIKLAKK